MYLRPFFYLTNQRHQSFGQVKDGWIILRSHRRNANEILRRALRFQEQIFILQWWRWTENIFLIKENSDWTWTERKDSWNRSTRGKESPSSHQHETASLGRCAPQFRALQRPWKLFSSFIPSDKNIPFLLKEDSFFHGSSSRCTSTAHRSELFNRICLNFWKSVFN